MRESRYRESRLCRVLGNPTVYATVRLLDEQVFLGARLHLCRRWSRGGGRAEAGGQQKALAAVASIRDNTRGALVGRTPQPVATQAELPEAWDSLSRER